MSTAEREQLLPCPFCGSDSIEEDFGADSVRIRCGKCGSQGEPFHFIPLEYDTDDFSASEGAARASWNARAALPVAQPEPIGEVVIGESGDTKGWTVVRWRADLPPIAVGTKLYAAPITGGKT